jgi:peptidyl-prolyl cis-trans isomerase B (cyclophilin B)
MVTFHTNHGDIVIKTFDDKAPETVKNFLDYCREGFYNNTIFHRVINGFMIQGGGFEPGMNQKATKDQIKNEANNGLKNTRGTLAMARTQAPHSATAQFFINVVDNDFLNSLAKACRVGATAYLPKWLKAWTWSTKSKPLPLAAAVCTRTCRKKTCWLKA